MDDAQLIDWYDIVESVANGRTSGHRCPECTEGELVSEQAGATVRIRCQACGMGFEGRLAHGRDDAFQAEAIAMEERAKARAAARLAQDEPALPGPATVETPSLAVEPAASSPTESAPMTRPDPWSWTLPATGAGDMEGYSMWIGIVEAVHNGRTTGHACPYCSEPLTDIVAQPPHIRLRCQVCGEAFEGRIG